MLFRSTQEIPDTPGQNNKKPMHIPVAIGLLGDNGQDLIETQVLDLRDGQQRFVIEDVGQAPVPSILRGFSAPVRLENELSNADLTFLMLHDSDGFNRWEAGQALILRMLDQMIDGDSKEICPKFMDTIGALIEDALRKTSAPTGKVDRSVSLSAPHRRPHGRRD